LGADCWPMSKPVPGLIVQRSIQGEVLLAKVGKPL
jgi:hypothetical protein